MNLQSATNHQLKVIMNYDRECPSHLIRIVVMEMLERGILKDFVLYHSKAFFGTLKSKQTKLWLEDTDIIQLGYIGIWKALDKYIEGKSSFSTFSQLYIKSEWQSHFAKFNSETRTMDREAISTELTVNDDGDTINEFIPSMENVEKTVLMKVYFESQMKLLSPLQRVAVIGHIKGYQNKEIAEWVNKPRQSVDRALKRAIEKMGGEAYTIKENCGMRKGA